MGSTLTLRFDMATPLARLAALRARAPEVIRKALQRGIGAAETFAVHAIAADLGVPQKDVRARFRISIQTQPTAERALLTASGKLLPLTLFGASGPSPSRGKGPGVTSRLGAYPHAFMATMPKSGHRGAFQRTVIAGRPAPRLPIAEVMGPSITGAFGRHADEALAAGRDELVQALESGLHATAGTAA